MLNIWGIVRSTLTSSYFNLFSRWQLKIFFWLLTENEKTSNILSAVVIWLLLWFWPIGIDKTELVMVPGEASIWLEWIDLLIYNSICFFWAMVPKGWSLPNCYFSQFVFLQLGSKFAGLGKCKIHKWDSRNSTHLMKVKSPNSTPRHITIKLLKIKERKKMWKLPKANESETTTVFSYQKPQKLERNGRIF